MRPIRTPTTILFAPLLALGAFAGCDRDPSEPPNGNCRAADAYVIAIILKDDTAGLTRHSAWVVLNGRDMEMPLDCAATVSLDVGSETFILEETQPGRYAAGYSDVDTGLPPLTLRPSAEHLLRIDLDSNGSDDITGAVVLSGVDDFRTTFSSASRVAFAWSDVGEVASTTYSVQASDEAQFDFADNFATGAAEGATAIGFGGGGEARYFEADPPYFARVQTDTRGTLSSTGRFNAWTWPPEPIIEYR